jgi:hypothetical protein
MFCATINEKPFFLSFVVIFSMPVDVTTPLVVGAYATAGDIDAAGHVALYRQLTDTCPAHLLNGFEIPLFPSGLLLPDAPDAPDATDATDATNADTTDDALLAVLGDFARSRRARHVITCIPATMGLLSTGGGHFGLASSDAGGRAAAIVLARRACAAVHRINTASGYAAVIAVELHSAPRGGAASGLALQQSLAELRAWDWAGAALVVEHCDATTDTHAAAKGFLPLMSEIAAVDSQTDPGAPLGLALNWARCVLETRTVESVVAMMAACGSRLRGFMFSGCSDAPAEGAYGAWRDSHMPFEPAAAGSWLTAERMSRVVRLLAENHLPTLLYTGVKVSLQPASTPLKTRAQVNIDMLLLIYKELSNFNGLQN